MNLVTNELLIEINIIDNCNNHFYIFVYLHSALIKFIL